MINIDFIIAKIKYSKHRNLKFISVPSKCFLEPYDTVKITRSEVDYEEYKNRNQMLKPKQKVAEQQPTQNPDMLLTPGQKYAVRDIENFLELCDVPRRNAQAFIGLLLEEGKLRVVDGGYVAT